MKRSLFIAALLIGSISATFAQSETKVWYGPKIGVDIPTSMLANPELIPEQTKGNFQIGAFLRFGEKFYIQPEAYYVSYSFQNTENSYKFLKVPLLLGVRLIDIGLLSIHATGGPTFTKPFVEESPGVLNWELGAGVEILRFLTADLRYTFQRNDMGGIEQLQDLVTNGGMVNLTVGIKLSAKD